VLKWEDPSKLARALPVLGLSTRISAMKFLDPDTEAAIRNFLARIPADVRLERAILYGSRARGEHKPDSDADLALILHERGNDGQTFRMLAGLAWDVFLETGIMIQPVPIAIEDWLHPEDFLRPGFLKNVAREGIVM
jgi:predicted nucleotidyltransferase